MAGKITYTVHINPFTKNDMSVYCNTVPTPNGLFHFGMQRGRGAVNAHADVVSVVIIQRSDFCDK